LKVQIPDTRPTEKQKAGEQPRYQPTMPQVPGVEAKTAASGAALSKNILIMIGAVIAVIIVCVAWLAVRRHNSTAPDSASSAAVAETPVADLPPAPEATHSSNNIATKDELAAPWSSKEFTYRRPFSGDKLPALVIHLPGGSEREPLYWGVQLQAPYNHCELKYVTDLSALASQYGFRAAHPMIVDTCNGSIFDPLKMGTLGDGSWTRGELVKGGDLRPPLAIEIQVQENRLVAGRAEQ
jgi:hypothetical protein